MASGRPSSARSPRSLNADLELSQVRDALRVAVAEGADQISVSRVRTPRLTALLPDEAVELLPVVWGRTLWGQASGVCIVEQPNGLGIIEVDVPADAVVVATLGTARTGSRVVGQDPPAPAAAALRGRLVQHKGVHPATRRFESSRFVLLFPCDPQVIVSVPPPAGVLAEPLGPDLAEYAGGVRFEVGGEVVESALIEYAAAVADRLTEVEGLT